MSPGLLMLILWMIGYGGYIFYRGFKRRKFTQYKSFGLDNARVSNPYTAMAAGVIMLLFGFLALTAALHI